MHKQFFPLFDVWVHHAEWPGGSPPGTDLGACRLWTVRKRRKKRRMAAACAPQTLTAQISTTFWGMLLILTPPRETPSLSTALVRAPFFLLLRKLTRLNF